MGSKEQMALVVEPPSSALEVEVALYAICSWWYHANNVLNLGRRAPSSPPEQLVMDSELGKGFSPPCING